MSSLNLKCMLTNSSIATIYIGLFILLFILTLKAIRRLVRGIVFIVHVSVRNNVRSVSYA